MSLRGILPQGSPSQRRAPGTPMLRGMYSGSQEDIDPAEPDADVEVDQNSAGKQAITFHRFDTKSKLALENQDLALENE